MTIVQPTILWVDDEIALLKPHIIFLEEKGYKVLTSSNADDALDLLVENHFDIIFLDEQMPGLSGLEVLPIIKSKKPHIPVVMVTKSEEENIMEDAIGSKISDYLIKPVNPKQILLTIKKHIDKNKLISQRTTRNYQQEFNKISMQLSDYLDFADWLDIYKKLTFWELELQNAGDSQMQNILKMQKEDANLSFAKYIVKNYENWLNNRSDDLPLMSHTLFKNKIFSKLQENKPTFVVLIDNLRYDQWLIIRPFFNEFFRIRQEDLYLSILPTATQYARNAFFSGLMPSEIAKLYPDFWKNDIEEGGKNLFEAQLLEKQLKRYGFNDKFTYNKVLKIEEGKNLSDNIKNLMNNQLNVIVYNFVDMLSHARTEMEIIKELAENEAAYRSLTFSWFKHSPLYNILKEIAKQPANLIITTDHGSIKVNTPQKVIGDRNTTSNLRYKQGKNLSYDNRKVYAVTKPEKVFLPKSNISSSYIFAYTNDFFVYPNNYNHYVQYYNNTFQHGGISLEEMLIPCIDLKTK